MHVMIGVENITFDVIIQRWQSPFWQVYDLALLLFALLHGVNGTRWVIDDYFHRRGWNVFLKTALYVVAFDLHPDGRPSHLYRRRKLGSDRNWRYCRGVDQVTARKQPER